jgi:hypothetical protein
MSAATDYLENEVLDHILGEGTRDFTSPANLFVGLFTAVADGEAGTVTEVSGFDYARTAVTFNTASGGSATNDGAVTFPTANGGNFGTVTHAGIYDASTGGNLLFYGALSVAKTVTDGDTFQIADTQLTISLA